MRFKCEISAGALDSLAIPTGYRQNLLSLVKEAIKRENENLYLSYYGTARDKKNVSKPFTFSVHLPPVITQREHSIICQSAPFPFYFSSPDYNVLSQVYNGLSCIQEYPLFPATKVKLNRFYLLPAIDFSAGQAIFRIVSPLLVRQFRKGSDSRYLTWKDAGFDEWFRNSLRALCDHFQPELKAEADRFQYEISKPEAVKVPIKKHVATGTIGILSIESKPEFLSLIYDLGIGARRSMGFGMLEVLS